MEFDPATTLAQSGKSFGEESSSLRPSNPPSEEPLGNLSRSEGAEEQSPRGTLENTLAELDGGADALACSSGAGALSTITHLFEGDTHVLCARDCDDDTARLFSHLSDRGTLSVSYEDVSDRHALTDAVRPNTAALWIDTPSSTVLEAVDLESLAAFADANDLLLIVNNTVLSPVLQRPIEHGADLVFYSSIQSLNGHSDVEGGAVVARTESLAEQLSGIANTYGTAASASDCKLVLRGIKTLAVRMRQHEMNARSVTHFLDEHPAVKRVYYPGLRNHPGHKSARKQQDGYGARISFVVNEDQVDATTLLQATEVFSVAESLGGVESRIDHPVSVNRPTGKADTPGGIDVPAGLIRLSMGIEATDDLIQDLDQALESARTPTVEPEREEREPVPVRVDA